MNELVIRRPAFIIYRSLRIGVSPQDREPPVDLFQQQGARPVPRQRHSRERQQQVRLLFEGCRQPLRASDQKDQFPRSAQALLPEPPGKLLRRPLATARVEKNFVAAAHLLEQASLGGGKLVLRMASTVLGRGASGGKFLHYQVGKVLDAGPVISFESAKLRVFCFPLPDQVNSHADN